MQLWTVTVKVSPGSTQRVFMSGRDVATYLKCDSNGVLMLNFQGETYEILGIFQKHD